MESFQSGPNFTWDCKWQMINADDKVNVHKAKDIGQGIIDSMVGKNVYELPIERKRLLHLHQEHLLLSTMNQCKWIHSSCSRSSVL